MSLSTFERALVKAVGPFTLAGAILVSAAIPAAAEPPIPPPCTAAELARVMSGVSFEVSNYLSTHPEVNDFFTSLKGQPRDQVQAQMQAYGDANPQVRQDLQAIKQPAVDFRQRCP